MIAFRKREGAPMLERNLLLAALPDDERAALGRKMQRAHFELGRVVYEQDEPVEAVHFPLSGGVSVVTSLEDGRTLEAALVGREGMLGFPIGLGRELSRWRSVVQLPADVLVMNREAFRDALIDGGHLGPLLAHYAGLLVTFAAQSAVCARFHDIDERLARWLLLMHDRAEADDFPATQDVLSEMVGAHRPTVTLAAGRFQDAGLIRYRRGVMTVVDREGLEAAACECYARVRIRYDQPVVVDRERPGAGHGYPGTE
jgi:CRP-like cAMP-binding protein